MAPFFLKKNNAIDTTDHLYLAFACSFSSHFIAVSLCFVFCFQPNENFLYALFRIFDITLLLEFNIAHFHFRFHTFNVKHLKNELMIHTINDDDDH